MNVRELCRLLSATLHLPGVDSDDVVDDYAERLAIMSADEYADHEGGHGTRPAPSDQPAEDDQGPGEGRARPLVPLGREEPGAAVPAPVEEGGGAAAPAPTAKPEPQPKLESERTGQGEQTLVPGVVQDVKAQRREAGR